VPAPLTVKASTASDVAVSVVVSRVSIVSVPLIDASVVTVKLLNIASPPATMSPPPTPAAVAFAAKSSFEIFDRSVYASSKPPATLPL